MVVRSTLSISKIFLTFFWLVFLVVFDLTKNFSVRECCWDVVRSITTLLQLLGFSTSKIGSTSFSLSRMIMDSY